MSIRVKIMLVGAVTAAVVIAVNLKSTSAQAPGMPRMPQMPQYVLEGNYRVKFSCAFPDNTTDQKEEELIKKIEFHPNYISLTNQYGGGRVVPVHAIKELTWEPS